MNRFTRYIYVHYAFSLYIFIVRDERIQFCRFDEIIINIIIIKTTNELAAKIYRIPISQLIRSCKEKKTNRPFFKIDYSKIIYLCVLTTTSQCKIKVFFKYHVEFVVKHVNFVYFFNQPNCCSTTSFFIAWPYRRNRFIFLTIRCLINYTRIFYTH